MLVAILIKVSDHNFFLLIYLLSASGPEAVISTHTSDSDFHFRERNLKELEDASERDCIVVGDMIGDF